jgi:peptidyl-prolyl cis-trans isomerase SurA
LERASKYLAEHKAGMPWDTMIVRYTDDQYSSRVGGLIGWVDYSKGFRPQFIDTVMQMNKPGEISRPFYSSYGVHVVRLDSLETPKTEEQQRAIWKGKLKQMDRYSEGRKTVFDKIRKLGNERFYGDRFEALRVSLRPNNPQRIKDGLLPDSMKTKVIYEINGVKTTGLDFWTWAVATNPDEPLFQSLDKLFETYRDKQTELAMLAISEKRFPEFAELSSRYRNGLTVYKITEDSVWEYSRTATEQLKALYDKQAANYQWGIRYKFRRYAAENDSLAAIVMARLKNVAVPKDSVANGLKGVFAEAGELSSIEDEPFNRLENLIAGDITPPFEFRKRINILVLDEVLAPELMSYEDAQARLVSDYQKIREAEWLAKLRTKFKLTLYPDRIRL